MSNTQIKQIVHALPFNPSLIQRAVIELLIDKLNSDSDEHIQTDLSDPTMPFNLILETACSLTSSAIETNYALDRRQYAASAQTYEDIYYHMTDLDYLGRFALPSKATFVLVFDLEEVKVKLQEDPELNIRKMVIPRDTFVRVGEIEFTMEYPIEIRELRHGGIQVIYDLDIRSPLHEIESNVVKHEITETYYKESKTTKQFLKIYVPMYQFSIRNTIQGITTASPVELKIPIKDHFYFARAFYQRNGEWKEIQTTHNPDIYDVDTPTAVLKVDDDFVYVNVPQIYTNKGLIDDSIRVDIYETKGEININLAPYDPNEIEVAYQAMDELRDLDDYTEVTRNLNTVICYSDDVTQGGRAPLSFDELKKRVKLNAYGPSDVPISNIEIEKHLEDNGFQIVKSVDVVTNRVYLASKTLPEPRNKRLITSGSSSIETIMSTINDLNSKAFIRTNNRSITILPDTLYESVDGQINIVPKSRVAEIKALPPELRTVEINKHHYYFSPFHYVMDFKKDRFDLRAYYLDKPNLGIKLFSDINDSSLIDVTVNSETMDITRTENGYRVLIETQSDKTFKDIDEDNVFAVMMFKPDGEREYAYLLGNHIAINPKNQEPIYQFDIETNYYIDENDDLYLSNFKMFNKDDRLVKVPLTKDMEIMFVTTNPLGSQFKPNSLDKRIPLWLLPEESKAIISEKVRIQFAQNLKTLWKQAKTVSSTIKYLKYTEDVPLLAEHDVLLNTESHTNLIIEDGKVKVMYLYRKGDPIVDERTFQPLMKHRKGDIVLNERGEPIVENPREVMYQMDIMLIEAAYYFATDEIVLDYKQEMIDTYVSWMLHGLNEINQRVLEQTKIYFYPKATLGQINIMYDNHIKTKIDAAQTLSLDIVVNKNVYNNPELKDSIKQSTIEIISDLFKQGTVSESDIITELTDTYGEDVIGVRMTGLGGNKQIIAMSVLDEEKRCSLKKRLVIQADNKLSVEEAVSFNFIRHDLTLNK